MDATSASTLGQTMRNVEDVIFSWRKKARGLAREVEYFVAYSTSYMITLDLVN
jgi:hypothetical protein